MAPKRLPDWDELPALPGHPEIPGCAWSVWGEGDELGTVNLLTPEVIAGAAKECIQTGRSCRLDWPLNFPERPGLGRRRFEHNIIKRVSGSRDDEVHFNPQAGSQLDGLRHYGFADLDLWYGDAKASEILAAGKREVTASAIDQPENSRLSIHHWAKHGIQGRGVLLDVAKYAKQIGLDGFHPFGHRAITVKHLEAVAKLEGVTFRQGDILLVRTGLIGEYSRAEPKQQHAWLIGTEEQPAKFSGVEKSDEMRRFLWNKHFSCLAGDAIAFEAMPPHDGTGQLMHRDILGLWGCPIGELWDLEELRAD